MIDRPEALARLERALRIHPAAALLGPRQCGKSTLARAFSQRRPSAFIDLENPVDVARMANPMTVLSPLSGLVVIDEVQRLPKLFEILRVLADRPDNPARFLLLGSASLDLVKGVSESLAGRIGFVDLSGFDLGEVGTDRRDPLWMRGGFPRSFLASDDADSMAWRRDFIRTFLERDIPQLGFSIPAEALRRFWTMVAHFHGKVWNASDFGRSLGTSDRTARRYLDLLSGARVIRVLPPWFENLKKRQVKSPKVYVQDSGLLHAFLGVGDLPSLQGHPALGPSWEGFAIEQVLAASGTRDAYFWSTHSAAELDLLLLSGGKRYGFEFKYGDAPQRSRSMAIAAEDLRLERLWVVYPGKARYDLGDRLSVEPLEGVLDIVRGL